MECLLQNQQVDNRQQIEQRQQVEKPQCRVTWWARFNRWRQLSRERDALSNLSDDMLKDIGISREAVQRESRRPFWDDSGWRR